MTTGICQHKAASLPWQIQVPQSLFFFGPISLIRATYL